MKGPFISADVSMEGSPCCSQSTSSTRTDPSSKTSSRVLSNGSY